MNLSEAVTRLAPAPTEAAAPLEVPSLGFTGVGHRFASLYARHLEVPPAFLYFAFLTYFGALVAKKITLDSELRPEPRLFTILLGESADTRKSTALLKADAFFRSLGPEWPVPTLYGVGSAEGIAAELQDRPSLILHFDEFKHFVDKARNEHSVALPMVSTLFDRGDYDNRTKKERLQVREASVSLLGACTTDTYGSMFDRQFFAIGFLNRLWLVRARSTQRIAVPTAVPEGELAAVREEVHTYLRQIDAASVARGLHAPVPYPLTAGAAAIFREWYANREGSIFERRLDTYGHRLLLLLAATTGRDHIDEDLAQRVVALLRYQLEVRRDSDPIDAENRIAGLEEKIRRALARGPLKERELKRAVHYERVGIWAWETALGNLRRVGEVHEDRAADLYWLAVVPTIVPTLKTGVSANGGESL